MLSSKKVTKLKGSSVSKKKATSTKGASGKARKVTKNLFVDFDASDSEIQGPDEMETGAGEAAKKIRVPAMKQCEAIQHVTARMSTTVFELIRAELPKLRSVEKDFLVSSVEDDVDLVPCVLWKIDAELGQMLQGAFAAGVTGVVQVRPNSTLDHVLILVQAPLLHECVGHFLESGAANSDVAVQSGGDGHEVYQETSSEPVDEGMLNQD